MIAIGYNLLALLIIAFALLAIGLTGFRVYAFFVRYWNRTAKGWWRL